VAGYKISMEMSKENVTDREPMLLGVLEVLPDITLRINDYSGLACFISDEIRGMREAPQIVLFEDHAWLLYGNTAKIKGKRLVPLVRLS